MTRPSPDDVDHRATARHVLTHAERRIRELEGRHLPSEQAVAELAMIQVGLLRAVAHLLLAQDEESRDATPRHETHPDQMNQGEEP